MYKFEVNDQAAVTSEIRRRDGRCIVYPGEIVTIIRVYDTANDNQVVDIQPTGNRPKLIDIVILQDSIAPLRKI